MLIVPINEDSASGDYKMRAIIVLLAIVVISALVGWISFSNDPDHSSINIETNKIRQDTKQVMQSSAVVLHNAGDQVEQEVSRPNE